MHPRGWIRRTCAAVMVPAALLACRPATTRPPYQPVPEAASTEIRLPPGEATRLLAEALKSDSIPTRRVELRDGWLETSWFDAATGATTRRRPIGPSIVRVRAWADPTHPGNSKVTVETVYHPLADPSLPQRELDHQVPRDHPVAIKVRATLQELVKRYGGPPPPPTEAGQPPADQEGEPTPEEAPEQTPEEAPEP